ncbi:tyrosine-type recombinase/integrase [Nonomuraea sp. NPDC005650]|uniref:tyrosine-type recombinase/integrase n=1 Tax=Nonomuraea sp. NPDC005650 TaxID=3157045 RepID=UPI0033B7BE28
MTELVPAVRAPAALAGLTPEAAELLAAAQAERDDTFTDEAADLISRGLADNTTAAYRRIARDYQKWCESTGRTALPASEATLANYVAHLAATPTAKGQPRAPGSIDQAIACILAMHDHARAPKPGTKAARLALRAYRKQHTAAGHRKKKAPPITLPILRQMIAALPADTPIGVRDRALLVLAFALMGRRSELAALDISDIVFTDDGLEVYIAMSKTDQDAAGETIPIPYGSHRETCPVRTVRAWLDLLAEHGVTTGALLRPIDKNSRIGGAVYPDGGRAARGTGQRMTPHGINYRVKLAAVAAELPNASAYSAHGLRAGGATSAAKSGAPMSAITAHGRWVDGSPVVAGYIRQVDRWSENPMRGVGL